MSMTEPTSKEKSAPNVGFILLYFGILTLLIHLASPNGSLIDIVTTYMLKNQLHTSAADISLFRFLVAIPIYIAFFFGLARDLWSPFGMRDRGYFLLFAALSACTFVLMARFQLSSSMLFIGLITLMIFARFIHAAYQGLMALLSQENTMSGRIAVLWIIISYIPEITGSWGSGYLVENISPAQTFMSMALIMSLLAVMACWKPRAIFSHAYDQPLAHRASFLVDVKRLARHKAIYPAVLIMFMFQVSPGSSTPLQFHLSNSLHLSDSYYGYYNAIFAASFIPTLLLYGYLCTRIKMVKLLWLSMIITVPQMIPLAFINSADSALWMAVPSGLLGGLAAAAVYDLAMRSCPPGLQGSFMMLVAGGNLLATRGGDILGTYIYGLDPVNGFFYCVMTTTLVYALILPVIAFIPKEIIATADGESNPVLAAQILAEIDADRIPATA